MEKMIDSSGGLQVDENINNQKQKTSSTDIKVEVNMKKKYTYLTD